MAIKDQCKVCRHYYEAQSICNLTKDGPVLNSRSCENYSRRSISLDKNAGSASAAGESRNVAQHESQRNNQTNLIICPECGRPTDSLKDFKLPYFYLFLGVYLSWQDVEYICCPSCMRRHILLRGFTYNILTFNIGWPFIILPWMIVQLIRTSIRGHSKKLYSA